MKAILFALVSMTCLTLVASAVDISGKWIVDQPTPEGNRGGSMDFSTYEFRVSGTTLTGSITRPAGPNAMVQIADGKINGDSFMFTTTAKGFDGIVLKLNYAGTVVGKTIKLSITSGGAVTPVFITLKRGSYR